MGHTRSQYEDRIRARLGDLGLLQHIEETQIPLGLEDAILVFQKDRPRKATDSTFDGDGTIQTFDLTLVADWVPGWSRITTVEHPTGVIPRTVVDSHDYEVDEEEDDLIFHVAPVAGTNNIKITFTAAWPFPDDTAATDLIPDVYFQAVTAKAAGTILRAKAHEFARQESTSVAGDLFRRDAGPLYQGANELDKVYTDTVLGRPAGEDTKSQVAIAVSDVDVFPASLFHRRDTYIAEEALGG